MKSLLTILLLGTLLTGCDVFDKNAINEYEAATKSWNEGDYQKAVQRYFALVKEHPSSSRADAALYWAGVTQFLYLGETEKALQTLRYLLKRYPRGEMAPSAQWYIAQIFELGYSDYERAVREYQKAAEYSSRDVREKSLYSLADNLFHLGRGDEARDIWMRQVEEFPNGAQSRLAYFRLGTAAFTKGDLDKAQLFYRKTVENSTDKELSIKAKFALAECFEASNNLREALKQYREIEPEYGNPEAIKIKIRAIEARITKKSY